MTMKKAILCVMIAASLAACGVKPGKVKPPSGSRDIYPATYPAPTDDQTSYDAQMSKIQDAQAKAEAATAAAKAEAENKPEWSVR